MTLNEYRNLILNAAESDWTRITCWGAGSGPSYRDSISVWTKGSGEFHNLEVDSHSTILSLRSDLLVSVAYGMTHNDDFIEDWANSFPDRKASSGFVDFFYSNQLVFRDIYVSVDGGRCHVPLPDINYDHVTKAVKSLTVPKDKFEYFRLLNHSTHDYDSYVERCRIEVVEADWMV